MSERKLRIKELGTFIIDRGNEIKWYKDKEKNQVMSGIIQWFSWKQNKQVSIKGKDGFFYLLHLYKDPLTRKWRYRVELEEDT
jgi:hypothetical protein